MDMLTEVLKTVTPSGGGFGRRNAPPDWGVAVPASELAIIHIVVRGQCWLTCAGAQSPLHLRAGHMAMLPHGHAHTISSNAAPVSPLRPRSCSLANVATPDSNGTVMACGFFTLHDRQNHPLLAALPALVHLSKVDAGQWLSTTIRMIAKNSGGPGGDAMLDQLAGLLFIQAVRAYVLSAPRPETGWLAGLRDPAISPALENIHRDPARDWTVAALAATAAMSRTAFSDRFARVIGQTPMAYVRRWRMHRAAHLLRTEGLSVVELCDRIGYRSEATFAKAFKRTIGLPPAAYRRAAMRTASQDQTAMRAGLLGPYTAAESDLHSH